MLDTNVIIDSLSARTPHNADSDVIFDLIADKVIAGYTTTSSLTDIYYILRRGFGDTDSRNKIKMLLSIVRIIEVTKSDCLTALESPMPDFEDALVVVCADRVNLDFIITRDVEFLKVPKTISPSKFLEGMRI